MEKVPMTGKGLATLEEELRHRQQVERPRIIQAIAEARALGDLSENAEYHAAKEAQSLNEGRVLELESLISRAEVIDVSKLSGDRIKFGATVKLVDEDTEEEKTYQIVGEPEADVRSGRVSITSPIARALIGKTVGDTVEVTTPGGGKSYEVVEVDSAEASRRAGPLVRFCRRSGVCACPCHRRSFLCGARGCRRVRFGRPRRRAARFRPVAVLVRDGRRPRPACARPRAGCGVHPRGAAGGNAARFRRPHRSRRAAPRGPHHRHPAVALRRRRRRPPRRQHLVRLSRRRGPGGRPPRRDPRPARPQLRRRRASAAPRALGTICTRAEATIYLAPHDDLWLRRTIARVNRRGGPERLICPI